jgi:hypothetical protein
MDKKLLVGLWRLTLPLPSAIWQRLAGEEGGDDPLQFMSEEHHRVRDFAVLELTRSGKPLPPERIAQELQLPQGRVVEILEQLERHKTFVFRNAEGAVTWAYPVTVDETPHRLRSSSGEQVYAA